MGGRLGVAGLCLDQVRGRKGACDWAVMIGRGGGCMCCVQQCVVLVLVLDCCVWWV